MKSAFLKKWVFITLNGQDGYFKGYVERIGSEMDQPAYYIRYEDGRREPIFVSSVYRIWNAEGKKARVIDFEKRRRKLLRVMR